MLAHTVKPIPLVTLRNLYCLEMPQDHGRKPKMGLVFISKCPKEPDPGSFLFTGAGVIYIQNTQGLRDASDFWYFPGFKKLSCIYNEILGGKELNIPSKHKIYSSFMDFFFFFLTHSLKGISYYNIIVLYMKQNFTVCIFHWWHHVIAMNFPDWGTFVHSPHPLWSRGSMHVVHYFTISPAPTMVPDMIHAL